MASRELQGWHPDPFGLHEMRYFSVGRPTKLVRDGRAEAYDAPPEHSSAVAAPSGAQAVTVDNEQAAAPRADALATVPGMAAWAPTAALRSVRPRGHRLEYAIVAAGAVVAVLVFVALGGGTSKPGLAPAAFVTKAAQRTLAQSTADVTMYGTVQVAGEKLPMGGNGEVDLAKGVMSANVGASASGGSFAETELLVGGNLYLQVTVDGRAVVLSAGRHWLEIPFAHSGAQNLTTGSPAASLALLSQSGEPVTALGARDVSGRTCYGYAVTPSEQEMVAVARQESLKLGFSQAEAAAALQVVRSSAPPTITAWFDAKTQLACQMTMDMQIGGPQSAGPETVQTVITFTHYGVPVNITAPAASDTISITQILHATHS